LLIANGAVLLFLRRWKELGNYIANMMLVLCCFAPMLWVIPIQISKHMAINDQPKSLVNILQVVVRRLGAYNLSIGWLPLTTQYNWLLYVLFGGVLITIIIKYRSAVRQSHIAIWISTFVVFVFFVILRSRLSEDLFEPRHTTIIFLLSIFSVFAVLSLVERKWKKQIIGIWVAAALLLSAGMLYTTYQYPVKIGDYARVAEYIMAREKPNQPILLFLPTQKVALVHYYFGKNVLTSIPKDEDFQSYDPHNYVFEDEKVLITILNRLSSDHKYIWFVKRDFCKYLGVDFNCDRLEVALQKYYSTETIQKFVGNEVRLLRRKTIAS
jgi:hypothetical protein